MEYSGWSLYDKVILVINAYDATHGKIPRAYVVDPKNKKQLEKAKEWGTSRVYEKNEEGKYIWGEEVEPEIFETDNVGFKMELYESANSSCEGGKLSFWNCIIYKEDKKFTVGIDSNLLLHTLKQCTVIKGKVEEELMFARCVGGVGLLHTEMNEYAEAVRDMQTKKNMSKGKTKKWELGYAYETLTESSVYMGELYAPLNTQRNYERNYGRDEYQIDVESAENGGKFIAIAKRGVQKQTADEYLNSIRESLSNIDKDDTGIGVIYEIEREFDTYHPHYYRNIKSTVSRKKGEKVIDIGDNYITKVEDLLNYYKGQVLEVLRKLSDEQIAQLNIEDFIVEVVPTKVSELKGLSKEILDLYLGAIKRASNVKKLNINL